MEYFWEIVIVLGVVLVWWIDPTATRYHRKAKKLLLTRAPSLFRKIWGLKEIFNFEGDMTERKLREIQLKIKQRIQDLSVIQTEIQGRVCGELVVAKLMYPNKLCIRVQNSKTKKAIRNAYQLMMQKHARDKVKLYPLVLQVEKSD